MPKISRQGYVHDISLPNGEYMRILFHRGKYWPCSWYVHHTHPHAEIQFMRAGRASYFIDGNYVDFTPNTLLVVAPNSNHGFMPDENQTIEKWGLMIPPKYMKTMRPEIRMGRDLTCRVMLADAEATCVEMIFRQISMEYAHQDAYWEEVLASLVMSLTYLIQRVKKRPQLQIREDPIMAETVRYVEDNFARDLTVPEVAEKAGYSSRHLLRRFKKYTGHTVKQFILHRRIREARFLMARSPGLTLRAIAEQVGFVDYHVFRRTFRNITGTSPGAYRRSADLKMGNLFIYRPEESVKNRSERPLRLEGGTK